MGPQFRVSSERLEKPRIEPTIPGLEGEQLNHYATEASNNNCRFTESYKKERGLKNSISWEFFILIIHTKNFYHMENSQISATLYVSNVSKPNFHENDKTNLLVYRVFSIQYDYFLWQ